MRTPFLRTNGPGPSAGLKDSSWESRARRPINKTSRTSATVTRLRLSPSHSAVLAKQRVRRRRPSTFAHLLLICAAALARFPALRTCAGTRKSRPVPVLGREGLSTWLHRGKASRPASRPSTPTSAPFFGSYNRRPSVWSRSSGPRRSARFCSVRCGTRPVQAVRRPVLGAVSAVHSDWPGHRGYFRAP